MLKPMIRTQNDYKTTVKNIVKGVIEYLESNNFNYVPVRFFEINNGFFEEYKTLDELKKSVMLENECEAFLYTFRNGYVYNEEEECSMNVLAITYEAITQ